MITVVGESLVDVVHHPDGHVQRHPGGSPANVAVGLARLGQDVQLLTSFGADADGRLLAESFARDGVQVRASTSAATSTATAYLDASGAATYTFDLVDDPADEADAARSASDSTAASDSSMAALPTPLGSCLHTGSLAALSPASRRRIRQLMAQARGRASTSFDPNCRPALMGSAEQTRGAVEDYLSLSDVVKVSEEDLAWLYPGQDPHVIARRWVREGPTLVVVTLGGRGCFATTWTSQASAPALQVDVVDTVGAGDSFSAALLDTLDTLGVLGGDTQARIADLSVADLESVLLRAVTAAAITCSRPGADPPTAADLDAVLNAVVPVL